MYKKSSFSGDSSCVEVDRGFFKSSFSGTGGSCVEVDRDFKLSSYTAPSGTCVAVARDESNPMTLVRNSNHPELGCVHFNEDEWQAFIAGVKAGEFD